MLNLKRVFKNYEEAGSLNAMINLFGFLGPQVFLTKSGEVGIVLEVHGVDYECLDGATVDGLTKRLESALRLFDENYRVYQLLFKRNRQAIPHSFCGKALVDSAIRDRLAYFAEKADELFSLSIYFVVLCPALSTRRSLAARLFEFPEHPRKSLADLHARFSSATSVRLHGQEITRAESVLCQKVANFCSHVSDFVWVRILDKQEAFAVLKRTLNFDPPALEAAKLKHDTFLDYYLVESHLECHRGYLRVGDAYVKVLTLKEPSAHTFPLLLKGLLGVRANYHVVTEWKKEESGKTRREIQAKRRHFHNTKRSFFSQVNLNDAQDALLDDAKESQVRELGKGIEEIELRGNYFGLFSLTVVIYERELAAVERAAADFYKIFSVHDAQLYEERYNLLNAFLAAVPGNYTFNLRYLYLLNTNYADLSFLFTLHSGETRNAHLRQEYLAVLETNHGTPYFLNLHYRDTAHTMILGRTGSGKSFLLNFLITNLQKYDPFTFIFDLGGSFESLTRLFGGSYLRVGLESPGFTINPFCLPPTKSNIDFLVLFLKVLLGNKAAALAPYADRALYEQIESLYSLDPELRTVDVLANTLPRDLSHVLAKWIRGGQFGFLFDNPQDTVSFSRFQCFDFQQMSRYPELLEPLLFYILHRANEVITDPEIAATFKAFFIDEAWVFLRNPVIQRYVTEALKTWRKHNAAMILSTQSLDELKRSDLLDIIVESCATKIFLANPDMDQDLYRKQFHLNDTEVEWIATLIPKRQFLIKTPELAKVANLNVDRRSYWLYTNDPYDNQKRKEAFDAYGFEKGLDVLAGGRP
ncbi:MAG TPA: type IV secretion system DNA-binding domain-containing protein [Candidatus Acidoferrum sp.]|nr:type IV secretion system DNA-binding domain-containing protein [Candidatus Acidoferrum sp.]